MQTDPINKVGPEWCIAAAGVVASAIVTGGQRAWWQVQLEWVVSATGVVMTRDRVRERTMDAERHRPACSMSPPSRYSAARASIPYIPTQHRIGRWVSRAVVHDDWELWCDVGICHSHAHIGTSMSAASCNLSCILPQSARIKRTDHTRAVARTTTRAHAQFGASEPVSCPTGQCEGVH